MRYSFRWCHVTSGHGGVRVQEGVGTDYECRHSYNHPRPRAGVERRSITFNSVHDIVIVARISLEEPTP